MSVSQTQFRQAILDPDMNVPVGLTDPQGRTDAKRFAVYRNNVAVSLTEALETAFPIIRKLVGDEFFKAMAGVFLRQHPPTSALMMFYGSQMPDFLESFEPVLHLGYLPDMARLELALRRSYHAADAAPIKPDDLQTPDPDQLMRARISLAPAVQLIRSDWPIHSIWLANTQDNAPNPQMQAQDVLITRPEFDPQVNVLPAGGGAFVMALAGGETLAGAITAAGKKFDLAAMLGIFLAGGAILRIDGKE